MRSYLINGGEVVVTAICVSVIKRNEPNPKSSFREAVQPETGRGMRRSWPTRFDTYPSPTQV